jgi:hypothetical protein
MWPFNWNIGYEMRNIQGIQYFLQKNKDYLKIQEGEKDNGREWEG